MSISHDYDKAMTRLVIILQRLYEGEVLGTSELAEEFNVSTKTIQRDFNERLIRFPITKEGKKWKMVDGHAINKSRTTEEELILDVLAQIAQGIGTSFGLKAKTLFSKLQNLDANPFYSKVIIEDLSDVQHMFQVLQKAISNKKEIEFTFKNKSRLVKPYKIVSFEGYWYLYGEDISQKKLKTYYLKDISKINVSDKTFKSNSVAEDRLKLAINAWFEPDSEAFEVVLHAKNNIAQYFIRRPLSMDQRIAKLYPDGSMDISLNVTCDKEILHEVKKWMPDLIVLYPENIVNTISEIAKKFVDQNLK